MLHGDMLRSIHLLYLVRPISHKYTSLYSSTPFDTMLREFVRDATYLGALRVLFEDSSKFELKTRN